MSDATTPVRAGTPRRDTHPSPKEYIRIAVLLAAVTALIGTAIALEPATDGVSGAAAAPESEPETTRGQDRLAWVGLSLLTCLTMLGATLVRARRS